MVKIRREKNIYLFIYLLLGTAYLCCSFLLPSIYKEGELFRKFFFGFSQLGILGFFPAAAAVILPLIVLLVYRNFYLKFPGAWDKTPGILPQGRIFAAVLSLMAIAVFFLMRNEFVNYDGLAFARKFARDIPVKGAHVTHDEMWELYLHSRAWYYTNLFWGWSVKLTYQVISAIAGGVFVYLLLRFCRGLMGRNYILGFAVIAAGGYMQLFFGDVENYTLTATLVMGYFLASRLYLEEEMPLYVPSMLLAIGITFHLLCGFLIPSMLYLYLIARRRREGTSLGVAMVVFVAITGLTLLFFDHCCLPISDLWQKSHASGHGGRYGSVIARPSWSYLKGRVNLLFLLVPGWTLIIPLAVKKRIPLDRLNIHLLLSSLSMLFFVMIWRATLGIYGDWNLFAVAAVPVSLLVGRNLLNLVEQKNSFVMLMPVWLFILHAYCWIVSNHYYNQG